MPPVVSSFVATLALLLLSNQVVSQDEVSNGLPVKLVPTVLPVEDGSVCPSNDQLNQSRAAITEETRTLTREKILPALLNAGGCGCGGLGWTRIAYLDMTDPDQDCPTDWYEYTSPRSCGRDYVPGFPCEPVMFDSQGIQYTQVCGRIKGYQFGQTRAFVGTSIDYTYVHGVSITHGSPRTHIWSFASAYSETQENSFVCPCTNVNNPTTDFGIPDFVGDDYFCETGVPFDQSNAFSFFTSDPLWDGNGCGPTSTCCQFNGPPTFCKQLDVATSDDVEVRICGDNPNYEDTSIEQLEIYIR